MKRIVFQIVLVITVALYHNLTFSQDSVYVTDVISVNYVDTILVSCKQVRQTDVSQRDFKIAGHVNTEWQAGMGDKYIAHGIIEIPAGYELTDSVFMYEKEMNGNKNIVYQVQIKECQTAICQESRVFSFCLDEDLNRLDNYNKVGLEIVKRNATGDFERKDFEGFNFAVQTNFPKIAWYHTTILRTNSSQLNGQEITYLYPNTKITDYFIFANFPDEHCYSQPPQNSTKIVLGLKDGAFVDKVRAKIFTDQNGKKFYTIDIDVDVTSNYTNPNGKIVIMDWKVLKSNFDLSDYYLIRIYEGGDKKKKRLVAAETSTEPKDVVIKRNY